MILRLLTSAVLAIIVGIAVGYGSAWSVIHGSTVLNNITDGPWTARFLGHDASEGPYGRARLAAAGVFEPPSDSFLEFIADRDSDGRPIVGRCAYRIEGADVNSRWWTLSSYGPDKQLTKVGARQHTLQRDAIRRPPDGSFIIHVTPNNQGGNWLPSGGFERFFLVLRLYGPRLVNADAKTLSLPQVVRGACQ
jgi:hypothetical protein